MMAETDQKYGAKGSTYVLVSGCIGGLMGACLIMSDSSAWQDEDGDQNEKKAKLIDAWPKGDYQLGQLPFVFV